MLHVFSLSINLIEHENARAAFPFEKIHSRFWLFVKTKILMDQHCWVLKILWMYWIYLKWH